MQDEEEPILSTTSSVVSLPDLVVQNHGSLQEENGARSTERIPDLPLEPETESTLRLAHTVLAYIGLDARTHRREQMRTLAAKLGCQKDNADNQAEHLESLVLSHLGRAGGEIAGAIDAMHFALMLDFERWRMYTTEGRRGRVQWLVGVGFGRAAVGSRETPSVGSWASHSPDERIEEASVYLLLWGEAGNLRFMPELLYFLVELALHHVRDTNAPQRAEPGSFLKQVVLPIYDQLFSETFTGLVKGRPQSKPPSELRRYPRNYDDCALRPRIERDQELPTGRGMRIADCKTTGAADAMPADCKTTGAAEAMPADCKTTGAAEAMPGLCPLAAAGWDRSVPCARVWRFCF